MCTAPPQITKLPNNTIAVLNRTAVFNCQAKTTIKFPAKIFWSKSKTSGGVTLDKLGQRFNQLVNGSLLINTVQTSDEGYYECHAENHIGVVTASAHLRVLGRFSNNFPVWWNRCFLFNSERLVRFPIQISHFISSPHVSYIWGTLLFVLNFQHVVSFIFFLYWYKIDCKVFLIIYIFFYHKYMFFIRDFIIWCKAVLNFEIIAM